MPRYHIDQSRMPWVCFPVDLDTSDFVDISITGTIWAKYYDPTTGETHNCFSYYQDAVLAGED